MAKQVNIFLAAFIILSAATDLYASTIYFQVAELGPPIHNDSYVLPLSDPQDIAYARGLIGTGPPIGLSTIVVANIEGGADGINRDFLAPGAPLWPWHVTEFLGFADFTAEILDGWPTTVDQYFLGGDQNGSATIGFWSYSVVAELDPSLFSVPIPSSLLLLATALLGFVLPFRKKIAHKHK